MAVDWWPSFAMGVVAIPAFMLGLMLLAATIMLGRALAERVGRARRAIAHFGWRPSCTDCGVRVWWWRARTWPRRDKATMIPFCRKCIRVNNPYDKTGIYKEVNNGSAK